MSGNQKLVQLIEASLADYLLDFYWDFENVEGGIPESTVINLYSAQLGKE